MDSDVIDDNGSGGKFMGYQLTLSPIESRLLYLKRGGGIGLSKLNFTVTDFNLRGFFGKIRGKITLIEF